ncbi:MAG TPA: class I SAM-dependent methyltransferase [Pirellulales bacterium]|jgi:phospholipid N-methyltransferase|nr:class I SAM-dependent methyltransferase [Pirellulales bacterium]
MAASWTDYRVFWREFRQHYHTTGAIAPSGRALAAALARFVGEGDSAPHSQPQPSPRQRRILEVGPGTGAVTTALVRGLGPDDCLDLVELNDSFVAHLRERFASEPAFRAVESRSRVLHQPLETLPADASYDLIVSGLPLNNFSVPAVEEILATYRRLLRPGGTLSFFEYIAIRRARSLVSGRAERARLRGIGRALDELFAEGRIARDWVWPNLPPAWVHHVRLPRSGKESVRD